MGGISMISTGEHASQGLEEPHTRTYFYVGGGYKPDEKGQHKFYDQMYVEHLRPVGAATQDTPVVLIHGQGQTGTNFLNKPDGGRGWASLLLQQGYEVYIVDQVSRGRSAFQPLEDHLKQSAFPAEVLEQMFTATSKYNLWPQASKHTQWPGEGVMGDPIFDAYYKSNVPSVNDPVYQQTAVQAGGAELLDKINKRVILVGHSQGGPLPLLIADARPLLVEALVLLEPAGPPFRNLHFFGGGQARSWGPTDVRITYSPEVNDPEKDLVKKVQPPRGEGFEECVLQADDPPPRQLINLVDKPILIMTGEASYHATHDYCLARYLVQAGCTKTKHLELGDIGIHGNGHMFFMEKNSDDIFKILHSWLNEL